MNEEHLISIGIVAKSQGAPEIRLRQLYQAAEAALTTPSQTTRPGDISVSILQSTSVTPDLSGTNVANVAVATDMKTGWFVQLVSKKDTPMLLTIGRKFCVSGYDAVNRHTATKMF
jgi:hypothetical protein